jgi:hypothetical protein
MTTDLDAARTSVLSAARTAGRKAGRLNRESGVTPKPPGSITSGSLLARRVATQWYQGLAEGRTGAHAHANSKQVAVELVGPKGYEHGWVHVGSAGDSHEELRNHVLALRSQMRSRQYTTPAGAHVATGDTIKALGQASWALTQGQRGDAAKHLTSAYAYLHRASGGQHPALEDIKGALVRVQELSKDKAPATTAAPKVVSAVTIPAKPLSGAAQLSLFASTDTGKAVELAGAFNEALHPRVPAGGAGGGEFGSASKGASKTPVKAGKKPAAKKATLPQMRSKVASLKARAAGLRAQAKGLDRQAAAIKLAGDSTDALELAVKTPAPETAAGRRGLAAKGEALPGGEEPIPDVAYLKKAIRSVGRLDPAKRPALKALIRKRARELNAMNEPGVKGTWAFEGANGVGAAIELVGPKGYEHGWHYVGPQAVGAKVFHPQLGSGTVTSHDGSHATVKFDKGGTHTFEAKAGKPGEAGKLAGPHPAESPELREAADAMVASGGASSRESAMHSIRHKTGYQHGRSDGQDGSRRDITGSHESYRSGYESGHRWGSAHPTGAGQETKHAPQGHASPYRQPTTRKHWS